VPNQALIPQPSNATGKRVLSLLILAFAAAPAQEPAPKLAFLEVEPAESEVWTGQIEEITIRFGIEAELIEDRLISVFHRPLDLPVRLDTQAWNDEFSIAMLPMRGEPADGLSFAWDGELAYARESTQDREGTRYRVFEVQAFVESGGVHSGSWRYPEYIETKPALLHLAYATAFETDFLGERVPVSEQRLVVESPPLRRRLRELPQGGGLKALQSSGVFREAKLTATITPSEVAIGEEFQIEVRVEGPLFMPGLDLIHPAELGWTLLGELELEQEPTVRRYRFDGRAEQAGELEFVPFRLVRFDPDLGEYRQDFSERLTLQVRGAVAGNNASAGPRGVAQPEPPVLVPESSTPERLPLWVHWLLGAGLLALSAWGRQTMRQSARRRESEATAGTEHGPPTTEREPLEAWLADQLGWGQAQLVDPALRARLLAAGVPQQLATETADFLQAAEAARYGGPAPGDASDDSAHGVEQVREELRRKWTVHTKSQVR
jgi:hypothetical protein